MSMNCDAICIVILNWTARLMTYLMHKMRIAKQKSLSRTPLSDDLPVTISEEVSVIEPK